MADMEIRNIHAEEAANPLVFALDIGTRSIIGMVGRLQEEKVNILAIEKAEHTGRNMIDGQIENIDKVAALAGEVKQSLERQLGMELKRVHIAAAGRALRTERVTFEMELKEVQLITEEIISRLEAGAISAAEEKFSRNRKTEDVNPRFYLAGYSICQYYLDDYLMSSLKDHHGQKLRVDIIATFLPGEVVESLYTTMHKIDLEVASITLEPIAAINAVIPEELRLLNLALADIGAGTSDIAACRDGSVIGYTMATIAGDEVTEAIMKEYLVDFRTAEAIKMQMEEHSDICFYDILGFEQNVAYDDLIQCINNISETLCGEIAAKIREVNGGVPAAVFLSGGGSKLKGLREGVAQALGMSPNRVAIAGKNFETHAYSEVYELIDPEYATPIGIMISAGLNLINDSFQIVLNDKPAKLFRSGVFNARDLLMMNGYSYQDMIGRVGKNIAVSVNGKRTVFHATPAEAALLKINGEIGKLSDVIEAGDVIEFHPAVHGATPQVKLCDIEGIADAKEIRLNGEEVASMDVLLTFGDSITFLTEEMEAEEVSAETEVQEEPVAEAEMPAEVSVEEQKAEPMEETMEIVKVVEVIPAVEEESVAEEPAVKTVKAIEPAPVKIVPVAMKGAEKAEQPLVRKIEPIIQPAMAVKSVPVEEPVVVVEEEPVVVEIAEEASVAVEAETAEEVPAVVEAETAEEVSVVVEAETAEEVSVAVEAETVEEAPAAEAEAVEEVPVASAEEETAEEMPAEAAEPQQELGITFMLNDKPLTLVRREKSNPYLLMDMLQYSGVDFTKLKGEVVLQVNGSNGYFQQPLKEGDNILIYEKVREE